MKIQFSVVTAAVLFTVSSFASFHSRADAGKDVTPAGFWDGLDTLASQCAVVPYAVVDGTKVQGTARSECAALVLNNNQLNFNVLGQSFTAQVQDSADSDGGDLNDLQVTNEQGQIVVQASNILAYGDVIQALVGSKIQLKEVYDPSVANQ
jgi:hypothetical protein